MSAYDPSGATSFIPELSQDETLGTALIQSLEKSRVLKGQQALDFFALEERDRAYEQWVHGFLAAHGNSCSRTALFKGMKLCEAFVLNSQLHLKPKSKERGEAWSGKGLAAEDIELIPFHSSATEIGAAIRRALAKCL
jgi:hypothetical protein